MRGNSVSESRPSGSGHEPLQELGKKVDGSNVRVEVTGEHEGRSIAAMALTVRDEMKVCQ